MTIRKTNLESGYSTSVSLLDNKLRERSRAIVAENQRRQLIRTKRNLIRKYLDRKDRPKKTANQILLEKLRKQYQRLIDKRRREMRRAARQYAQDIKKEALRHKDMQHPQYRRFNKYRYHYFGNHILTRSFDGLTANRAWSLLRKCWIGFKDSARNDNREGMVFYAQGIQKYLYYLEEVPMDFGNLGVGPFK